VVRTARRHPGFVAGVAVTLGLGIGANATMYVIIDRLLLSPPEHIVRAEEVRRLWVRGPNPLTGQIVAQAAVTYPDYEDLKAHSGMAVAAYRDNRERTVGTGEAAMRAQTALASAEFFPLLGIRPRLGRFFTPEEAAPGAPPTVVIAEELWIREYGADAGVLGRVIEVAGVETRVIGVAPRGFTGVDLRAVDLWLPLEATGTADLGESCLRGRGCRWMSIVARLRDGVSVEAAEAEATRLHLNGRREEIDQGRYPATNAIVLSPLVAADGSEPSAESRVALLLGGVSLIVLLIACTNVANLLLGQATKRRHETAVRLALGVGRGRLVAHAFAEATVFALAGGVVGLAIVRWGGPFVRAALLPDISFPDALSARAVLLTLLLSLLAGVAASVVPAIKGSRPMAAGDLAGAAQGHSAARSRLRTSLTASQAALSTLLLVGAGLFVRSIAEIRGLDLGLDVDRLLVVDLEFTRRLSLVTDAPLREASFEVAMQRVAALPEVEAVTATATPFGTIYAYDLRLPDGDSLPWTPGRGPFLFVVAPGYFEVAGLSITRGRGFDQRDGPDAERVTLVNETMARGLWPGAEPLGRCIGQPRAPDVCMTVVGVVEDAARADFRDEPAPGYYLPMRQAANLGLSAPNALYIRTRGDASEAQPRVAALLRAGLPDVRWASVYPMRDTLDRQARSWTLGATMFTVFGLLALVVAAVGLYSVLAFDVAQRTREIGIRSALGARKGRLLRTVVTQGTSLGAAGVAVGLGVAYLAAPYTAELLFEVSPRDPAIFAGVGLVLLAVSLAASLAPALRATRVDPVAALKSE
jgi:predicted permease